MPTTGSAHAPRFINAASRLAAGLDADLVIGFDVAHLGTLRNLDYVGPVKVVTVDSHGTRQMSAILNEVLACARGEYVLRLDDDEEASPALRDWLSEWRTSDSRLAQYLFPRLNLWKSEAHALAGARWYPDWQARLSTAENARRDKPHQDRLDVQPTAEIDAAILHHLYLVRSEEWLRERTRTVPSYAPGGASPSYPASDSQVIAVGDGSGHTHRPKRRRW